MSDRLTETRRSDLRAVADDHLHEALDALEAAEQESARLRRSVEAASGAIVRLWERNRKLGNALAVIRGRDAGTPAADTAADALDSEE